MKKIACILFAGLLSAGSANAMLIKGMIGWGGEYERVGTTYTFSNIEVDSATRDLAAAGITDGTPLTMAGFDIGAFTPVSLWTLNGFTYTLESIAVAFDVANLGTVLTGSGTLSAAGFEDTPYRMFFTSNPLGTFSASAVPEPGSLALLSLGLAGFAARRRLVRA